MDVIGGCWVVQLLAEVFDYRFAVSFFARGPRKRGWMIRWAQRVLGILSLKMCWNVTSGFGTSPSPKPEGV